MLFPLVPALALLGVGLGSWEGYRYWRDRNAPKLVQPVSPATGEPVGSPAVVTKDLLPGKVYALNVFVNGALSVGGPTAIRALVMSSPETLGGFAPGPKEAVLAKSAVTGSPLNVSGGPVVDQWLVYVTCVKAGTLPAQITQSGGVVAVIDSAIDITTAASVAGAGAQIRRHNTKKQVLRNMGYRV